MDPAHHNRLARQLYRDTAPHYEDHIAPVMAILAVGLLRCAQLGPADCVRVLDIGAGTGVVARLAAPHARHVTAVDFSGPMLAVARRQGPAGVAFVRADAHALPSRDAAFDVALANFCFSETCPAIVLAEAYRILRPGGRLALQDWGLPDALTAQVERTLAEYATTRSSGFQTEMRQLAAHERPWDQAVAAPQDIEALLLQAGFDGPCCRRIVASVPFATSQAFIDYILAWSTRRAEVEAMPASRRRAFYRALRARLGEGALLWQPVLFRAYATK
jgi:SAM-dependent methyltransferase